MSRVQIAVTFIDDSERFYPVPEGGSWTFRTERGLSRLVIGRGVPRIEIPTANVKSWEVLRLNGTVPEGVTEFGTLEPTAPDPSEVDRVVEWAERRARGDDDQRCPAVAYDHGAAVRCDTSDGHGDGDPAHRNEERGIQWIQTISRIC